MPLLTDTDSATRVAEGMIPESGEPALCVEDLEVSFRMDGQFVPVVRGISLALWAGKTIALVGESGSGKSVSALSVLGLAGSRRAGGLRET